jgi:hypothetical protein
VEGEEDKEAEGDREAGKDGEAMEAGGDRKNISQIPITYNP